MRFNRQYKLTITLDDVENIFSSDLRIQFEATKSIRGSLNKMTLKIYNLKEANRLKFIKDAEDKDVIPFSLDVGYGEKIENIYQGTISTAQSERKGSEFITTIESIDGGVDLLNSFTSKTVKGKDTAVNEIVKDFSRITKGKITTQNTLIRPKVLVGNSINLIAEQLNENETFFIDNEKLYILKINEVVRSFIPVINSATGLLNQPQRANQRVTFKTLLNPSIIIGGQVELKSDTALHLNGVYKVETIKYNGDNYGSEWFQECSCMLSTGVTVL